MLSLAPFKYRNVLSKDGGPVEKLLVNESEILIGRNGFEASVYLKEEFRSADIPKSQLYGDPDGTGSDIYKSVACYKAISESLERWAYYLNWMSDKSSLFGFDIDPSSNGMAAFPGFSPASARNLALYESLERWSLIEWWQGNLKAEKKVIDGIDCLFIPVSGVGITAILWKKMDHGDNFISYGFAASKSFKQAYFKAQVELLRNIFVLKKYCDQPFKPAIEEIKGIERRLIWFASKEGHKNFLNRVESSITQKNGYFKPRLIIDRELKGPWSKYASVWRCLHMQSVSFLEYADLLNFFLF